MKKAISLLTVFAIMFTGTYKLPAEELTSGEAPVPGQTYVYQMPEQVETGALAEDLDVLAGEEILMSEEMPDTYDAADLEADDHDGIPAPVGDASGTCGESVSWKLEGGVLTISGTGEIDDYANARPPWYNYHSSITNAIIKPGVTRIGVYAFYNCTSMWRIEIPDTVTTIGRSAFTFCESLGTVQIPNSVVGIGDSAFSYCSGLEYITIPDSVTRIGRYAFDHCFRMTRIIIPASVTSIGNDAFNSCSRLTVYGSRGSYIEDYADEYGLSFADLASLPTPTPTPSPTPTPIPMQKIQITNVYNSQKGGDIRWKKGGSGVTGYVVYRQRSAEGIKKVASINDLNTLQYIDPGIVTGCWGRVYHYYICPLYGTKEGPKSDKLVLQRLAPMKITGLQNSAAGKATCTYACTVNENKALGYEIQYAQTKQDLFDRKGTFKKVSVEGRKNLSKVITGFTKGKTYYFRVRCYVDYEHSVTHQKTKTWSQYSEVKSIKILK